MVSNWLIIQGNPAFFEALEKELLTKTAEEIREHEQWYTEFITLQNSKKRSIVEWREQKRVCLFILYKVEQ